MRSRFCGLGFLGLGLCGLLLVGCGDDAAPVATSGEASTTAPSTTSSTTSIPPTTTTVAYTLVNGKPHFETPVAAMTYLAAAWNANDLVSLKHVTEPNVREELAAMRSHAVNLRLKACEFRDGEGDYLCTFNHDFPPGVENNDNGEATFVAGPADTPGWYMTIFESCN